MQGHNRVSGYVFTEYFTESHLLYVLKELYFASFFQARNYLVMCVFSCIYWILPVLHDCQETGKFSVYSQHNSVFSSIESKLLRLLPDCVYCFMAKTSINKYICI